MKSSCLYLIFVLGVFLSRPSYARIEIVSEFYDLHNATQKVKQDVQNLLVDAKSPIASTVASIKSSEKVSQANNDGFVFPNSNEEDVSYSNKAPIFKTNENKLIANEKEPVVITTTPVITTTTVKDGRETLSGGCATGFKRTPDGRCMPTF